MSEPRRITERYRLEKRISFKESGTVFRAVDTVSGEIVAVKLINQEEAEEQRALVEADLAILQTIQHPALPRLFDYGVTTAGSPFLVLEHLAGDDLAELVEAPPARLFSVLLQLVDGMEALAVRGLTVPNLGLENVRIVAGPDGEQAKILGLGGAPLRHAAGGADGPRADLYAFAELAARALRVPLPEPRTAEVILPSGIAGALADPPKLRELLETAFRGDPTGRFLAWREVRGALRTALDGATGSRPVVQTAPDPPPLPPVPVAGGTAQIPRKSVWEEVRLGQDAPAVPFEGDATMAVERIGPVPAPGAEPEPPRPGGTVILSSLPGAPGTVPGARRPAPPVVHELTTKIYRPEDLATGPPAPPPAPPAAPPPHPPAVEGTVRLEARPGTMRIPMKELEETGVGSRQPAPPAAPVPPAVPASSPPGGTLRFPSPSAPPPPPPPASVLPFPAPPRPEPTVPPETAAPPSPPPLPLPPRAVQAMPPPPAPPPPRVEVPQAPVPQQAPVPAMAAPQAEAPRAAVPPRPATPRPGASGGRIALLVGVPVAVLLVVAGGLLAWRMTHSDPPPPPKPAVVQTPPPPKPAPPPEPPAPKPVHAQILLAEEALLTSDLAGAKAALDAIPPEQVALFTVEEQERFQRAKDALTPLQGQQWAESLARGLSKGDVRLLRAALNQPPDAATLTPEQKKGLARARKIVDLDNQLTKAQKAKNPGEILRQSGLLLAELPGNTRALQARRQTAEEILAEVDQRIAQGQLSAAQESLEPLRSAWSDHPGLAQRVDRIRTEQRYEEQMENALAAAERAERAGRPLDGIQALDRMRPNARWTERFQQARERLQNQLADSDRNPPQIARTGASEPSYKKGATVTVALRITDDLGVEDTEAHARPEGGSYTRITVRHVGGADYEIEIPPDLHQNKDIDFYVTATDRGGHTGSLGSAQRPVTIKRKKWFS